MTLPTYRDRFDKPTRRQLLNHRLMARMLLASGGVWLAMLAFAAVASGANPKPNVIVIFTDDQTYRGIGYNNPEVKTPHLDALAASGITFERGYVARPICAASRASMMTGRFPQQHGVMGLGSGAFAPYRTGAPAASQSLAYRLAKAGGIAGRDHYSRCYSALWRERASAAEPFTERRIVSAPTSRTSRCHRRTSPPHCTMAGRAPGDGPESPRRLHSACQRRPTHPRPFRLRKPAHRYSPPYTGKPS